MKYIHQNSNINVPIISIPDKFGLNIPVIGIMKQLIANIP
jgi:hypothetical protein